ncbi:MAG TPA: hydantoinase/oxoprolinase family protein [Bacillota bacterium]
MKRIGVDVGGTFTDLILFDDETGRVTVHKVPSTPADPSIATIEGTLELCRLAGVTPGEIQQFFHGTTVATNIVLERKGARVGMITTEGFRDILHIARKKRPFNFSLQQDLPWQKYPLVPRRWRLVVSERMSAQGEVLKPLDEEQVRQAARRLREAGVEAICICFLNSFANGAHELRAKEIVAEEYPDCYLCTSYEVLPQYREYERFSTVALNAYIGPRVGRYIENLTRRIGEAGVPCEPLLMQSSGGTATASAAKDRPVTLLLSGPVAGLIGGIKVARASGYDSVITLDVGGTSADIGVAPGGVMRRKHLLDTKIGDYNAMVPMVDMDTIGAGGGSIAFIDEGGMFRVGPRSAGADPGPACYDRGGTEPTITDCFIALGHLRPENFLGGRLRVRPDLARAVIREHLADRLGMSVEEAALGALRIVTANMVRAMELNSVRKGYDPREFSLVAFGGAGPLFACGIARELGIPTVIVPPHPGITSAMGLLATDIAYEYVRTTFGELRKLDPAVIQALFDEMETEARERLLADGVPEADIRLVRYADCRYLGQGYELRTPAPSGPVDEAWLEQVARNFHEEHERQYFRRFEDSPVQIINIRVAGIGLMPELRWERRPLGGRDPGRAQTGETEVWFMVDERPVNLATPIYRRDRLEPGNVIEGPAIIEQFDSTTVVIPGMRADVDAVGNLIIT